MKKMIVGVILLFFSSISVGSEAAIDGESKSDQSTEYVMIIVKSDLETSEKKISVSLEKLKKYPYFDCILSSDDGARIPCRSLNEAAALEKIIRFAQDENLNRAELFVLDDFLELTELVFKNGIDQLGHEITKFLLQEYLEKISKNSCVLLDSFTRNQFDKFYSILCSSPVDELQWHRKEDNVKKLYESAWVEENGRYWCSHARDIFAMYCSIVHQKGDGRAKNIQEMLTANERAAAYTAMNEAAYRSKRESEKRIFYKKVRHKARIIYKAVQQNALKDPLCCKEPTLIPRKQSFLESRKYAKFIVPLLQQALPAYHVFINTKAWNCETDLSTDEGWPQTLGGYCASACGYTSQASLCFCQFLCCLICNTCLSEISFDWLNNRSPCNTQIGGAVRHFAYKCPAGFRVWITIEPKNYDEEALPIFGPPAEVMS